MANKPSKPRIGRRSHHFKASKRHVTQKANYPTAINKAAKVLGLSDQQLAAAFNHRAVPGTIRAWRNGARKAPQWALEILYAQLSECTSKATLAFIAVESELTKEKAGD